MAAVRGSSMARATTVPDRLPDEQRRPAHSATLIIAFMPAA
jgi:hypothetical protein